MSHRQYNITVHLGFGPKSIAAEHSVNGEPLAVIYCNADNESSHSLAPFFAKMDAVLWCHDGPCNSMGTRDLSFSLGLCRPDLYCKCIFVYRQASREPLTPAELPENKVRAPSPLRFF